MMRTIRRIWRIGPLRRLIRLLFWPIVAIYIPYWVGLGLFKYSDDVFNRPPEVIDFWGLGALSIGAIIIAVLIIVVIIRYISDGDDW